MKPYDDAVGLGRRLSEFRAEAKARNCSIQVVKAGEKSQADCDGFGCDRPNRPAFQIAG